MTKPASAFAVDYNEDMIKALGVNSEGYELCLEWQAKMAELLDWLDDAICHAESWPLVQAKLLEASFYTKRAFVEQHGLHR